MLRQNLLINSPSVPTYLFLCTNTEEAFAKTPTIKIPGICNDHNISITPSNVLDTNFRTNRTLASSGTLQTIRHSCTASIKTFVALRTLRTASRGKRPSCTRFGYYHWSKMYNKVWERYSKKCRPTTLYCSAGKYTTLNTLNDYPKYFIIAYDAGQRNVNHEWLESVKQQKHFDEFAAVASYSFSIRDWCWRHLHICHTNCFTFCVKQTHPFTLKQRLPGGHGSQEDWPVALLWKPIGQKIGVVQKPRQLKF